MKIKLFNRESVFDSYYSNGMTKYRQETNEEIENRVNEFIADKKVIYIRYQEATYEDMSIQLSIMVMYEEVKQHE